MSGRGSSVRITWARRCWTAESSTKLAHCGTKPSPSPGRVSRLLLGLVRNAQGSATRARGDLDQALALHQANLSADTVAPNLSIPDVCADLALLGRWPESVVYARQSARFAHSVPAYARMHMLPFEVEALLRAHEYALARSTLESLTAVAGSSPRYQISIECAHAALAHYAQDAAAASAHLATARALPDDLALPVVRAELLHYL
jgi:hypothetical protein